MKVSVPLSPEQTRVVHLNRYPDGLVCQACGHLIATRGYGGRAALAGVSPVYTCAECRMEAAQKVAAFARLKGALKRQTEAQLAAAGADCTWCRRWYVATSDTSSMACAECVQSSGGGWALPGEIPAPATLARTRQCGGVDPVQNGPISGSAESATCGHSFVTLAVSRRRSGRRRQYASAATRQRAYRLRQHACGREPTA